MIEDGDANVPGVLGSALVEEEIVNVYLYELPSRFDRVPPSRSLDCLHNSLSICHKEDLDVDDCDKNNRKEIEH
jgi:hypothetical protein